MTIQDKYDNSTSLTFSDYVDKENKLKIEIEVDDEMLMVWIGQDEASQIIDHLTQIKWKEK